MLPMVCCLLAASAAPPTPAVGVDELYRSWERDRREVRSLTVTYTTKREDRVFNETKTYPGVLHMRRTPQGASRVLMPVTGELGKDALQRAWLVTAEATFSRSGKDKRAIDYGKKFAGATVHCVRTYDIAPLAGPREAGRVRVMKTDRWYAYLQISPSADSDFKDCLVVVNRETTATAPRHAPVRIWFREKNGMVTTTTVNSWRVNPKDGPPAEEFDRPEERAGWTINPNPLSNWFKR